MKFLLLFVLLDTLRLPQTPSHTILDSRISGTVTEQSQLRAERASLPSFDVASIRRSEIWKGGGEGGTRSGFEYSPGGIRLLNVNVSDCLQWAYNVRYYQISGPQSLNAERYDIVAKVENPASLEQLRQMMRDLLADRFKVTLHHEMRTLPVYELVTAKRGAKLPVSKADDTASASHAMESLPRVQDGNFVFQNTSIAQFAEQLSQLRGINRPVLDRTGIQGTFDITLKDAAASVLDPNGPSLFTLIEEQLGLKLQSTKAPVDTLVIDHAEKPSEN